MIDGVHHGLGYYIWPLQAPDGDEVAKNKVGHVYVGSWKTGMMHGKGRFQHRNGFVLEPLFSNNLAQLPDSEHFSDPFMSE